MSTYSYEEEELDSPTERYMIVPHGVDDPLFENVVRCISRQCQDFMEKHGGEIPQYFVGMSFDLVSTLGKRHRLPATALLMIRDGLDRLAAQAVIQRLVKKGCSGDDQLEEQNPISLYMYRIIPMVTVQ